MFDQGSVVARWQAAVADSPGATSLSDDPMEEGPLTARRQRGTRPTLSVPVQDERVFASAAVASGMALV